MKGGGTRKGKPWSVYGGVNCHDGMDMLEDQTCPDGGREGARGSVATLTEHQIDHGRRETEGWNEAELYKDEV